LYSSSIAYLLPSELLSELLRMLYRLSGCGLSGCSLCGCGLGGCGLSEWVWCEWM